MRLIFIAFLVLTCAPQLRGEGLDCDQCFIGPKPDWVIEIPFPELMVSKSSKGSNGVKVEVLLFNHQFELDQKEKYFEYVEILRNGAAVRQESKISIEFDPAYQSVALHQLCIYRNRQWIEKKDTSRMEVVQQEHEMGNDLYSGRKTWFIFIEDVRPGDVIKCSYSIKGQNPLFGDRLSSLVIPQQWWFPIHKSYFRLVGSDKHILNIKQVNGITSPSCQKGKNGGQEWIWEMENPPEIDMDYLTPNWYFNDHRLFITEYHSWSEVARWGADLFQKPLYHSDEMQELTHRWNLSFQTEKEKILKALRFVQDEIRYMGFEEGVGSHKPRDPNIVLSQRFGDCKDKSLLLVSLLDLLGIRAFPVLVSTNLKEHVIDMLPTPDLFNHAIVQIDLGENSIWVDPTASFQGGELTSTFCPSYGKGLVIDPATEQLSDQPNIQLDSLIHLHMTLEVSADSTDCHLKIKQIFTGGEADKSRNTLANDSLKNRSKNFLNIYSSHFGHLTESIPLSVEDDREKNIFTVMASYEMNDFWHDDEENKIRWYECSFLELLDNLQVNLKRKDPLGLQFPCHIIEELHIINSAQDPAFHVESNCTEVPFCSTDALSFSQSHQEIEDGIHIQREIIINKDHISVAELTKNKQLLSKIQKNIEIKITELIPQLQ